LYAAGQGRLLGRPVEVLAVELDEFIERSLEHDVRPSPVDFDAASPRQVDDGEASRLVETASRSTPAKI
jgi:hypothetical protein